MVRVTSIMIALILFVILLTVALLMMSGVLPSFTEAFGNYTQRALQ